LSYKHWKFRIEHILQAIQKIQDYTSGLDFDAFTNDTKTIDAVIRNFMVIGEAANNVPDEIQEKYQNIPWRIMKGMRNVLVHNYDRVKEEIIWDTIQLELDPLIPLLQIVLYEADD